MARAKQRDARDHAAGRLEGRPKALRRELSDLEIELERARTRRDRAQARVEALEAIAEQLTVAIAAADAARDARRERKASSVSSGPDNTPPSDPVRLTRSRKRVSSSDDTTAAEVPVPDEPSAARGTRRSRKGSAVP